MYYTMRDDLETLLPERILSNAGLEAAPSPFASIFYGDMASPPMYLYSTGFCKDPSGESSSHKHVRLNAHLHRSEEETKVIGFASIPAYEGVGDLRRISCKESPVVTALLKSHFTLENRAGSTATSVTALSDCHLSRKEKGGFATTSVNTFFNSDDSFRGVGGKSFPGSHDNLVTPKASLSRLGRESVGSGYYRDALPWSSEDVHGFAASSTGSVASENTAQDRFAVKAYCSLCSRASHPSADNSFSLADQPTNAWTGVTSSQQLHTQPLHLPPEIPATLDGEHSPSYRRIESGEKPQISATDAVVFSSDFFGEEFGDSCFSLFHNVGAVAAGTGRGSSSPSSTPGPEGIVSSVALGVQNSDCHLPSQQKKEAASGISTSSRGKSVSAASVKNAVFPEAPAQPLVFPTDCSSVSTAPNVMRSQKALAPSKTSSEGVGLSASCQQLRRDLERLKPSVAVLESPSCTVCIAGTSTTPSFSPVRSFTRTEASVCTQPTSSSVSVASVKTQVIEIQNEVRSVLTSRLTQPPREELSNTSSPRGGTSNFTVAPPSNNKRHPRSYQRRRCLETPALSSATDEMQLTMAPFSPRRDVPPRRSSLNSRVTQTLPNTPVPPPQLQCNQIKMRDAASLCSPVALTGSTASLSLTPEKLITMPSGAEARRAQQRRLGFPGFPGFFSSRGGRGLCAPSENINEKSLRSIGGRSATESRLLGDSGNGIMSRSCPSVEYSSNDITNPFSVRRSVSWSVQSGRSTADSGDSAGTSRRRREGEHIPPTPHETGEAYVMVLPNPSSA